MRGILISTRFSLFSHHGHRSGGNVKSRVKREVTVTDPTIGRTLTMSTATQVSQHLQATKKMLQGLVFDARYAYA